jgi:hypothetical protein
MHPGDEIKLDAPVITVMVHAVMPRYTRLVSRWLVS